MKQQLPPLTALRAFDAAARHLSFAQAADELNVTPAALSFQIKSLEEHLGHPLFRRLNRAVELTEAGRTLAPGTGDGFRTLTAAWRAARRLQDGRTLTVTAGPGFTAKWLAPRFYEFARAHPEYDLRFSASLRRMDFDRDEVDVAIRFGLGRDGALYSVQLGREWVTPVMAPELAARYPTPESLRDAPFLFDDHLELFPPACDWGSWFRAAGVDHQPNQGTRFSQSDHAIDAAISGAGVVLGRATMMMKDLREGRLAAPFPIALACTAQFRFLCPEGHETRPQIAAFRDWVLEEIEKSNEFVDRFDIIPTDVWAAP